MASEKVLELSTTLGCRRKSHCSGRNSAVVPDRWQHALITQQQRSPALRQIAGLDKKKDLQPQQCSAAKLPHRREVASCSAAGVGAVVYQVPGIYTRYQVPGKA